MTFAPTSSNAGLRVRVERLLRGDFRAGDLTELFLYARGRCDGRQSVQEIGDFAAHHDERSKGIVTDAVRDFFTMLRFTIPRLGLRMDAARLPESYPSYLRAVSRQLEPQQIKRDIGLRRVPATKLLDAAIKRLVRNGDGTWSVPRDCRRAELEVLNCFGKHLISKPAFDDNRLYEDFAMTLKSHALLKKEEAARFAGLKSAIALYAITAMHKCIVILPDGSNARLTAIINPYEVQQYGAGSAHLGVDAAATTKTNDGRELVVLTEMFATSVIASEACDPQLLERYPTFDCDLEVGPDMKLTSLS